MQHLLMSVCMCIVLSAVIIDLLGHNQEIDHTLVMLSDSSPEAAGKCGYEPKREIRYCVGAGKAQKPCFFPS